MLGGILDEGEPHISGSLHSAHLVFAFFHVSFGLVVHVETGKSEEDTQCLDGMNRLSKPENCDGYYGDALYEGSDGVSDGGGGSEDDESDYVLSKVYGAVKEEIVEDGTEESSLFLIVTAEIGVMFW